MTVCVVASKHSNLDVYQWKVLVPGAQSEEGEELPHGQTAVPE